MGPLPRHPIHSSYSSLAEGHQHQQLSSSSFPQPNSIHIKHNIMQQTKNLPLSPNSIALQSIPPSSPPNPVGSSLSYTYRRIGSSSSSCDDHDSSESSTLSSPTTQLHNNGNHKEQHLSCLHSSVHQPHVSQSVMHSSSHFHSHTGSISVAASTAAQHSSTSATLIIACESSTASLHTHTTTLHPQPCASPSVPTSVSMSPIVSSIHPLRRSGAGGFYEVGDPMSTSTSEHSLSQLLHEADQIQQHSSQGKTSESHSIPTSMPTKPTLAGRSQLSRSRGNAAASASASPVVELSPAQKAQDRLNLVGTLACALEQLCPTSVPLPIDPMFLSLFHTSALPSISVGDYLSRLTSYTSVSEECLIQACIHIFTLATNGKREEHRRKLEQAIRAQKKRKLAAISKRMVSASSTVAQDEFNNDDIDADDGGDEDDSHLSYDSSDSFEPDIMSPNSFSSSSSSLSDESATPSIDAHHSTRPTHPRINSFSNQPFLVSAHNIHRLLLTAILATSKFVDDAFYNNNIFSTLGGVSLKELNRLELEFLRLIDYRLFLSPEVFLEYYQQVFNHQSKHGHWCMKPHHALGPDYQLLREESEFSSSSDDDDSSDQGEEYEQDLDHESGLRAEGEEVDHHVEEEINMAGVNLAGASSATPFDAVGVAPYNSPPNAASLSTTPVYQAVPLVSPNSPGPEEERPFHEPIHLMESGDAHEFQPPVHHHEAHSVHEHKDPAPPSFFSPNNNNKRHHSTNQAHSFHALHQTYEQLIACAESDDGVMQDVSSASPPQRHAKRPNTSVTHHAHTRAH